ncbi:MAG: aspartate carbamoyltransferase [Dehalococcoidales bacterium]
MILANRNLVTIDDFSNGEIEAVFTLANEMAESVDKQTGICQGKIMASLFFEPSTRTRLSFEAAMHRLGGSVISVSDATATSQAKGESIADMARIVGSYADIIVIRHPWEGAAKVVADYAGVPVINAGDGGHQHPTQTLCDLFTIKQERQTIKGLKIALWGDLKYGRTIHSLIFALAKFGANILFCPSPGMEVPPNIIRKLVSEYGGELESPIVSEHKKEDESFPLDAIYITPSSPHQLAMMPGINFNVELKNGVDALYVTRPQKERFAPGEGQDTKEAYPVVDMKLLEGKEFKRTLIMHPLPRVDELAHEVDADPRSMYFQQAAWGIPIRMALLALLLGKKEAAIPTEYTSFGKQLDYPVYRRADSVTCSNPICVTVQASEKRYLTPEFWIVNREPLRLRCVYCEHGFEPNFVASSDWHAGREERKKYHSASSHWAKTIKPENLVVFNTAAEAKAQGYKPSQFTGGNPQR